MDEEIPEEDIEETGEVTVPPELLELHLQCEIAGCTAEEFKEYADAAGD